MFFLKIEKFWFFFRELFFKIIFLQEKIYFFDGFFFLPQMMSILQDFMLRVVWGSLADTPEAIVEKVRFFLH